MICNPILPGFNPDPCLIRVGSTAWCAVSTFEWWPGIALYRSEDLATWTLAGHAVTRPSQADLRLAPDSGGLWAPGLSHDGERFHLTYTMVTHHHWPRGQADNLLITATDPMGPWSEPIHLCGSGWDPSLCHGPDGRRILVWMRKDPRPGHPQMSIAAQVFDPQAGRLVGRPRIIFTGSDIGGPEGPPPVPP
jgi:xylan 1,4-beta-xylosidase